ncbi:hypothetical protein [Pseudoroseicyclus sp. CXY001]|uniref:hypothetical protein n=1 Tax=Pseudoroseicyclus sp. CXY001 TaxID=3242492 RepID=UPI003570B22E
MTPQLAPLQAFHAALQIDRDELIHDRRRPVSEPDDARIPQMGYIGPNFRAGNPLLLAINPGGGGDAYRRTTEDRELLPLIDRARRGRFDPAALAHLFERVMANMRKWSFWRIVKPTLEACGAGQDEVSFLNWVPYRTRMDAMPFAADMRACRDRILLPLIDSLRPGVIIALGRKAGGALRRLQDTGIPTFVVPRTRGDSFVSAEAQAVLAQISNER